MSKALLIKVIGASTAGSAAIAGVGFSVWNLNNQLPNQTYYVVASTTTGTNDIDTSTIPNHDENKRNYTCQFDGVSDEKCLIKPITIDSTKKFMQLSEVKNLTATDTFSANLLNTANKYFRVEVSGKMHLEIIKDKTGTKHIDVLVKNSSIDKKKFGALKPLFSVNGSIVEANTDYSIGKVSALKTVTSGSESAVTSPLSITQNSNSPTCLFTNSGGSVGNACNIISLSSTDGHHSDFSTMQFSGSETNETQVKINNYYLFKFTGESSKKATSDFKKSGIAKIKVNSTDNIIEVSDLLPVSFVDHSSTKSFFMLGDYPTTKSSF